jgi:plastocyanin
MKRFAFVVLALAACTSDPAPSVDAPSSTSIATVDCATVTPAATVTTTMMATPESDQYMPKMSTITMGGVVKFVMPNAHNVAANTGTDAAVSVGFGETKCLRFTMPGTYNFHCVPHGFQGSVTVN